MNISIFETLTSHIEYWKSFIQMIFKIYKTYSNYPIVLTRVLNRKFPVESMLRNGKQVSLQTFNAMYVVAFTQDLKHVQCDIKNDLVNISSKTIPEKTILHGAINNGDIICGFLNEDYGKLPIKDKVVIDVGSNIGDTAIYFALHGAKKIIGLEPFPKNYELANKNIITNNLSDKIIMLLAGCSSEKRFIKIDPEYESNHESKFIEFQHGKQIPLLTLEDIIIQYNVPFGSILKMDCEGCEYDTISSTSEKILKRFSHIQIEYHFGYMNLKKKLEKCGFNVIVGKPRATDVINTYIEKFNSIFSLHKNKEIHHANKKHRIGYAGFIYAINDKNI